jgi:hypothetical protein
VSALVRAAAYAPAIDPVDGSRSGTPRTLVLDGSPARVRRCEAPPGVSLASLVDRYDAVATRESDCGQGRTLPHATVCQGDVAFVVWTSSRDGHRKGVIASVEGGIVRYTLLDGEPLPGTEPSRSDGARLSLPGGITAPEGSRAGLTLEEDLSGFACFLAPGSSDSVASELRSSLERAGYSLDAKAPSERDARAEAGRVVVSFRGKDRKGVFVVAPERPALSRVTLALR